MLCLEIFIAHLTIPLVNTYRTAYFTPGMTPDAGAISNQYVLLLPSLPLPRFPHLWWEVS